MMIGLKNTLLLHADTYTSGSNARRILWKIFGNFYIWHWSNNIPVKNICKKKLHLSTMALLWNENNKHYLHFLLLNTIRTRLYPKMTKKSLKKIEISRRTACQVVSDSKLNVERRKCLKFGLFGNFVSFRAQNESTRPWHCMIWVIFNSIFIFVFEHYTKFLYDSTCLQPSDSRFMCRCFRFTFFFGNIVYLEGWFHRAFVKSWCQTYRPLALHFSLFLPFWGQILRIKQRFKFKFRLEFSN